MVVIVEQLGMFGYALKHPIRKVSSNQNCLKRLSSQRSLSLVFNYLCTYDLYSTVHNVLDACISITRASGQGLGPGILEFFGPCEMA